MILGQSKNANSANKRWRSLLLKQSVRRCQEKFVLQKGAAWKRFKNQIQNFLLRKLLQGPLNCQKRVKAVVSSKPLGNKLEPYWSTFFVFNIYHSEICDLEPIKQCRHVTKLVPQLKPVTECTNVPKEICATSKINPRKVARPAIQKWCYTPDGSRKKFQ